MILMELMMMVIEEGECGGEDVDDDYYGDCGGDGADDDQNCFMWRTMVSAPPLCVAPRVDSPPDIEPHQRSFIITIVNMFNTCFTNIT